MGLLESSRTQPKVEVLRVGGHNAGIPMQCSYLLVLNLGNPAFLYSKLDLLFSPMSDCHAH